MFCYIAGATFVLQDIYGLSAQQFSVVFAVNALGILVAGQASRRLVGRYTPHQILAVGVAMSVDRRAVRTGLRPRLGRAAARCCRRCSWSSRAWASCIPNATALALADHPRTAGSASALLGVAQFVFGGLAAPLVGVAGTQSAVPLGVLTAVLGLSAGGAYLRLTHASPVGALVEDVPAVA